MSAPHAYILVPPFASTDNPSLGCHVLQGVAGEQNFIVRVLYVNIIFAKAIGLEKYRNIVSAPPLELVGERLLSPYAFPSHDADNARTLHVSETDVGARYGISAEDLSRALSNIHFWLKKALSGYSGVVGISSTFEQINASVIISRMLAGICPTATQVLGGANCEGEMALGQEMLLPNINYIFSGESEATFVDFLAGARPKSGSKVIAGTPKLDLDSLSPPNFDDYFEQLDEVFDDLEPRSSYIRLPYESSRGCWWGAKHHCTFCGLNGEGMSFRAKNAEKVMAELVEISRRYKVGRFFMTDNIMPHSYFKTLLPMLAEKHQKLDLFYEQKANISLDKILLLRDAGVEAIQPGIESLDNEILASMKKGVRADQNIALLRYCRSSGVYPAWNLIFGFPFELEAAYERLSDLIPLLHHLHPPSGLSQLSIDRFSPYFDRSEHFGIYNIRPNANYSTAFPENANLEKIAYHFEGVVPGSLDRSGQTFSACSNAMAAWRTRWEQGGVSPVLHIIRSDAGFILIDTRRDPEFHRLSEGQATACLSARGAEEDAKWAVERDFAVILNGIYTPLATANPEVILSAEKSF